MAPFDRNDCNGDAMNLCFNFAATAAEWAAAARTAAPPGNDCGDADGIVDGVGGGGGCGVGATDDVDADDVGIVGITISRHFFSKFFKRRANCSSWVLRRNRFMYLASRVVSNCSFVIFVPSSTKMISITVAISSTL